MGKWIKRLNSPTKIAHRLICFPYAGGGTTAYRNWVDRLPNHVEVWGILLPRREERFREPHLRELKQAIDQIIDGIDHLLDIPVIFYGHSMGAILAHEVAKQLKNNALAALIVSGHRAPHLPRRQAPISTLPYDEFIAKLRTFGGTPEEILNNKQIMQLVEPAIRGDMHMLESYTYQLTAELSCPLYIFGGDSDSLVTRDELDAWHDHTNNAFQLEIIRGGHFFIHHSEFVGKLSALLAHISG